jgi:hypothetical protein
LSILVVLFPAEKSDFGLTADAVWDSLTTSYTVNNSFGQRVLRSTTSQSAVAVTGSNHVAADIYQIQAGAITSSTFAANAITSSAISANAIGASELAADAVSEIAAAVSGAGGGAISTPVTLTTGATPITGAGVWITTDSAGSNVIAGTLFTDGSGTVTFLLDAGLYYIWCQKLGFNFTNPTPLTVT